MRIGAGLALRKRNELLGLLRPCFARTEPWLQAGKYVSALVSGLPRVNGWSIARHGRDRTPDRTQRLLNHASWDTSAAMSVVRRFTAKGLDGAAAGRDGDRRDRRGRAGKGRGGHRFTSRPAAPTGFRALTSPADVSYRIDRPHDPTQDVSIGRIDWTYRLLLTMPNWPCHGHSRSPPCHPGIGSLRRSRPR